MDGTYWCTAHCDHLWFLKYLHKICIRFMELVFAQKTHEGLGIGHILRKFASLKEGVGENFPNTGREIVSARR